jgi:hypothetical protein
MLLKPTQKVVVEWKYESLNNPIPVRVRFEDTKKPVLSETYYSTTWKGSKLKEWLKKNTTEIIL